MSWPTHQSGPCVASRSVQPTHAFLSFFLLRSFANLLLRSSSRQQFILYTYARSLTLVLPSSSSFFPFFSLSSSSLADLTRVAGGALPPHWHTLLQHALAEVLPQPRAYFTQGLYPSHTGFSKDQTAGTLRSMDLASISMSPGRFTFIFAPSTC